MVIVTLFLRFFFVGLQFVLVFFQPPAGAFLLGDHKYFPGTRLVQLDTSRCDAVFFLQESSGWSGGAEREWGRGRLGVHKATAGFAERRQIDPSGRCRILSVL